MNNYKNISPRRGKNNYQLVLVPKKRMKIVFVGGSLRRYLGNFLYEPAKQKSIVIVECNLLNGSMEGYSALSKKDAHPSIVGYLKGRGALEIARDFKRRQKPVQEKKLSVSVMDTANRLSAEEYPGHYETEEAYFAQSSWI